MTEPMILKARIPAPLAEVHRALTDPAALQTWLAEHAEVELPHRYEFWGRYTPEGDAPHQRLQHVDERTLRFGWLLDGEDTTVEIALEPDGDDATVLTLSQTHWDFSLVMAGESIRRVLQTFWSVAIANLADYVDGRELTPKVDFTATDLRASVLIDAGAGTVYDALTDSAKLSEWFGFPIAVDLGARTVTMGGEGASKIVDLQPGRSMSTDWGPGGVSTWELEESGGKTRLTFMQSGFDTGNPPYDSWGGWLSGMAALRRYVEVPDRWSIWLADEQPQNA
jgi:uncharacterized protein YndB with AHSA1/START domain